MGCIILLDMDVIIMHQLYLLSSHPEADTKIQRMQGQQTEMEDALKTLQGEIKDSRMIKWICCSGWYSVPRNNMFLSWMITLDIHLTYYKWYWLLTIYIIIHGSWIEYLLGILWITWPKHPAEVLSWYIDRRPRRTLLIDRLLEQRLVEGWSRNKVSM